MAIRRRLRHGLIQETGKLSKNQQLNQETWYYTKDLNREYYTPFSGYKRQIVEIGRETLPSAKAEFINSKGDGTYRHVEWIGSDLFSASTFTPINEPVVLPKGVYRYCEPDYNLDLPERLEVVDMREDKYVQLDGPFALLEQEIKRFIDTRDYFIEKKLIHKRGILLYGSPGNGKTVFIHRVIEEIIPEDSITIMVRHDLPETAFLDKIRFSLHDRLKVFIFEELAITAHREQQAEALLNFLDGCDSIDGSLILATTNYPERLPGNIVDRPSRIDTVIEIGNPEEKEVGVLIKFFTDREATAEQIKVASGLSIAAIKEACLLTHMKGYEFTFAVKANKERSKLVKDAFAKPVKVGFGFGG